MSEHHRTVEWRAIQRALRPILAAQLPQPCVDCGQFVHAEQKWQIGHIVPAAIGKRSGWTNEQINDPSNLGPTHTKARGQRACNQISGGRLGAAMTNQKKKDAKRLPNW